MTLPETISADYTLRPSELAEVLATLVKARQPCMVWGGPGTGKSQVANQTADRLGYEYIDIRGPLLDPVDLRGIPWRDEHGRTRWAPPGFLPPTDSVSQFLVNLDELPSSVPMVQVALFQFCLERKIGEYEAPPGAAIIACGNREQDRSIVHRMAGCIVTVAQDGSLQVVQGLVKPEDMPKQAGPGSAATSAGNGHDPDAAAHDVHTAGHGVHTSGPSVSTPMASPRDREAEARKEAGVGIGHADDQRAIRTALIKAYLAGDFEAAFDLALFQMGRSVFAPGYHDHALDIAVKETPDRPNIRMNDEDFADWSPGEAMLADRSHLPFDWLTIADDGESFAALRALPEPDKQALFAACVARTVKGQLAFEPQARPELEATVARLDIDFAKLVRPTAATYWSRIGDCRHCRGTSPKRAPFLDRP